MHLKWIQASFVPKRQSVFNISQQAFILKNILVLGQQDSLSNISVTWALAALLGTKSAKSSPAARNTRKVESGTFFSKCMRD